MNNGESLCGVVDCDYSEVHELPLVQRIMRTIEQYNREQQAEPCPACLRDAMLTVAALMHLRESAAGMPIYAGDSTLEQEFAWQSLREAARSGRNRDWRVHRAQAVSRSLTACQPPDLAAVISRLPSFDRAR